MYILKILFWHSESYFDIRYETENPFDNQNPIFDILYDPENLSWHLKSYFDIRSESKNPILTFDRIQKILFWHSLWAEKFYFDIQNTILTLRMTKKDFQCQNWIFRLIATVKKGFWMSPLDFPTHCEFQDRIFNVKIAFPIHSECQNRIVNVEIGFSNSANLKIGFWHSKYDFPTHSECRKMKNENPWHIWQK